MGREGDDTTVSDTDGTSHPARTLSMATYAIGDIHGCFRTLQRLLERLDWSPGRDRLWLVGDLVNGGPDSLRTLRWARDHSEALVTVLGNHDLHMLAVAAGEAPERPQDTFRPVLDAPEADELLDWLRRRPMLHRSGDTLLVHAGLLPSWTPDAAERLAAELEDALRSREPSDLFEDMYGNRPRTWRDDLEGIDRLRVIVNAFTRMRTLDSEGGMDFEYKQGLDDLPDELEPWFGVDRRQWTGTRIVCGHWSAVGYHRESDVHILDSSCVWGGSLTALRLDDEQLVQVDSEMPEAFD